MVRVFVNISDSLAESIAGSITAAACFTVILTYFLFKDLRNLRYIELVFYVSLNDFIGSIGIALGRVPDGSPACWFQGISTTMNYLSSMFWVTVITYQVWLVVHRSTVIKNMTLIHCICWGWPALMAILPLSTNIYGHDDDSGSWCFIATTAGSPSWGRDVWELLSFYLWVWVVILVNVGFLVSVSVRFRSMQIVTTDVSVTMTKLVWYPAILFVCWACSTMLYFLYAFRTNDDDSDALFYTNRFSSMICILQGFFSTVAFFVINKRVCLKWKGLLYNVFCLGKFRVPAGAMHGMDSDSNNSDSITRPSNFLSADIPKSNSNNSLPTVGVAAGGVGAMRAPSMFTRQTEENFIYEDRYSAGYDEEEEFDYVGDNRSSRPSGQSVRSVQSRSAANNRDIEEDGSFGDDSNSGGRQSPQSRDFASSRNSSTVTIKNILHSGQSGRAGVQQQSPSPLQSMGRSQSKTVLDSDL